MKLKSMLTLLSLFCLALLPSAAHAQNDLGVPDSLFFTVDRPNFDAGNNKMVLRLWMFNDAQKVASAAAGFKWINAAANLDSAKATPAAVAAFDGGRFLLRGNSLVTSNNFDNIQFGAFRFSGDAGLPASTTPTHVATYWFTIPGWQETDSVILDTNVFSSGTVYKFVDEFNQSYFPIWNAASGKLVIHDENYVPQTDLDTLVTTDSTLDFTAVVGATNPATQTFVVAEIAGENISFSITEGSPWINLTSVGTTTPDQIVVGVDITGLGVGTFSDTITVTSTEAGNTVKVAVNLTLTPPPPNLIVTPDTLSFSATLGGANPSTQNFSVFTDGASVSYDATETSPWLTLSDISGTTPDDFTASVDISGLAVGTYLATVSVTSPGAANSPQTRIVKLEVMPAPTKTLTVSPTSLSFSAVAGGSNPATQDYLVFLLEGGAASFTSTEGATWITLTNPDGTTPGTVTVNVDVTGVGAGTYSDTITVTSPDATNGPVKIPVTLTVTEPEVNTLVLSTGTLIFEATAGGANPASQTFNVTEADGGNISFSATEDATWLSLTDATGTTPGTVTAAIDIAGLPAGVYVDTVTVTAPDAENSPQLLVVTLTVNAAETQTLVVEPRTLTFETYADCDVSLLDTVNVTELDGDNISFTVDENTTILHVDAGPHSTPHELTVVATHAGLAPGVYVDSFLVTATDGSVLNGSQWVVATVTILECPKLVLVGQELTDDTLRLTLNGQVGDSVKFCDTLQLGSTGASLEWLASQTGGWNLGSTGGMTPDELAFCFEAVFDAPGTIRAYVTLSAGLPDLNCCNSSLTVCLEINISEPGDTVLVVSPLELNFSGSVCTPNPAAQCISVTELAGQNIDFSVHLHSDWLSVDATSGTTPDSICVSVNDSALVAGTYSDSINITAGNASVWVHVNLTVAPCDSDTLVVAPTILSFSVVEGCGNPPSQLFAVSELGGGEVSFDVTETSGWISTDITEGTTPASVMVSINATGLDAGHYMDSILVMATDSSVVDGKQWVRIDLVVVECPSLVALEDTLVLGDTIRVHAFATVGASFMWCDSLALASTGGQLYWFLNQADSGFDIVPTSGYTPDDVRVCFNATFDSAGTYTSYLTLSAYPGTEDNRVNGGCCYSELVVCLEIDAVESGTTVGDTVWVENTPAVPGMSVWVPLNINTHCPTSDLFVSLRFDADALNFEQISFDGTLGETLTNTVTVDNDLGSVMIRSTGDLGAGTGVWANLKFSVDCETMPGAYAITSDRLSITAHCSDSVEVLPPTYITGYIVIDSNANYVCGYVVNPDGDAIEGATVLLYTDFPCGEILDSTTSASNGSFAFADFNSVPFDLYAYVPGYYPGTLMDVNYGQQGVEIVLHPLKHLTPTSEWVDYYCDHNTFEDCDLPVGSVVEAYADGMLVGQFWVSEAGSYGFMPVYRSNEIFGDEGAETGDIITFYINGLEAEMSGNNVYPAEYAQIEMCLKGGVGVTKICPLLEGWNLVSWNVNTETDHILDVLGPYMDRIEVVLGFEQGGLTYDPDLPEFSTLWSVDHLSGYWIKVKPGMGFNLEVSGSSAPVNTPIPVTVGWNLVSYLPVSTMTPEEGFASISENLLFAYGWDGGIQIYDPDGGPFNTLDELSPCNGYWVKVSANDELIYPGGFVAAPKYATAANSSAAANDVAVTNSWVNLYAYNLQVDGGQVKAGASISAVSSKGTIVGSYTMTNDGRFGFMPVYADANGEDIAGLQVGEEFKLVVNGVETQESFTWTGNGDRILINNLTSASGGGTVPNTYSLAQNYPNPFNPSTTISFTLPSAGKATVEVYNVLGALVATPYEGEAVAGENNVVWDGKDLNGKSVASGVYFYRLSAGAYSEVKKMMLLK